MTAAKIGKLLLPTIIVEDALEVGISPWDNHKEIKEESEITGKTENMPEINVNFKPPIKTEMQIMTNAKMPLLKSNHQATFLAGPGLVVGCFQLKIKLEIMVNP